jgi:hypothetical protein
MKILKWYTEEECKEAIAEFLEKFYSDNLSITDTYLFFKTLFGVIYRSKEHNKNEEFKEIWENLQSDIEEFGSLGYCVEVWGSNFKIVMKIDKNEITLGTYEGQYEPLDDVNYCTWISLMPDCTLKVMKGGLITEPELLNGDCVINGSVTLSLKPRNWIQDLFSIVTSEAIPS